MTETTENKNHWSPLELLYRLIPEGAVTDIESRTRARLTVGILFFGALAAVAMSVVRWYQHGLVAATIATLAIAVVFVAIIVVLRILSQLEPVGDLLVLCCSFLILMIAYSDGGLSSRVLVWGPAVVLLASFLGHHLKGLVAAAILGAGLLLILMLQLRGHLPNPWDNASLIGRAIATIASMLFIALVGAQYERARRRSEAEYEALESERRNWLSMVTHELRTPLTAIYGALSLLQKERETQPVDSTSSLINMGKKNAERLIRMVNNILEMERLQAGGMTLDRKPVDLGRLVEEACQFCDRIAHDKGVTIERQFAAAGQCLLDEDRITQVLLNLLSNAIKFSPQGDKVTVLIEAEPGWHRIRFRDNGPGIPDEFMGEIFGRFAQAQTGQAKNSGGTGLGLYVSRLIAEAHGGKLDVAPCTDGCEMVLSLPE